MDIAASGSLLNRSPLKSVGRALGAATGLVMLCSSFLPSTVQAKSFSGVDGEEGVLHISGELTQGACRLEMQSALQQVELGTMTTGDFTAPGQRGTPVPFQLVLRDCLVAGGRQQDAVRANTTWDAKQSVVSVSFVAPADVNTPELVKIKGASGLGLRLLDRNQHDVRLGNRSEPLFVAPYHDVLTWYVVPERTSAPLVAGAFSATVNFRMNYD